MTDTMTSQNIDLPSWGTVQKMLLSLLLPFSQRVRGIADGGFNGR
jgi:hypothetical protein